MSRFICFFKQLKRKVNFFWQLFLLLGLLILYRVECRFEKLYCTKDEKIIIIKIVWNLATYCDDIYEVKTQYGKNLF